jgi:hypothetical protein
LPKSLKEYHLFFPKEVKELIKPSLFNDYLESEIELLNKFKTLIKNTKFKDQFTDEEINNAHILYNSRAFNILIGKKEYFVLIPLVDMSNYDYLKTNTYWKRRLQGENDFFTLKTIEDVKAGEQIYVDYGRDGNRRFFSDYGYTIANNPFFPSDNDLEILVRNKKFKINLKMNNSQNLIKFIEIIKKDILKAEKNTDKTNERKIDIEIVSALISGLGKYSDLQKLEKIKSKEKDNQVFINIYRVLKDELVLLNINMVDARSILRILNSETNPNLQYPDDPTYYSNKKYFDKLFS